MPEFAADSGAWLTAAVLVLALERAVELAVSHRNLARLYASGTPHAASSGALEYALMVAVHALFLACPLIERELRDLRSSPAVAPLAILAIAAAQALRWWTVLTLGPRWNARAIVAPALGAVHGGPYRFARHPNYVAVMLEFAALPFVGGTFVSGACLFLANAWLLARRKRQEEALLAKIPGWREGFER